jgi:polysaccharide chain length determinant protein (PEP-CTERM system associated)
MPIQELIARILGEIRGAWRFRWYGLAAAWVFCLLGWTWAIMQPNVYEANARVYVDSSSALRPILNNQIVRPDFETQLAYVRQALLGREHLERVVRENDLDLAITSEEARETLLGGLRERIRIEGRGGSNTLYNISYRHSQREKAVGVVRTLLNSLVETTLGASRAGTDTAERFLDERIQEYEHRLQDAELARANFKKENAGRLPGAEGGYFERIATENTALEAARKTLRLAESRRDRIIAQLNSENPVVVGLDGPPAQLPPNSLDARIRDHRAQLDALLLQYTDRHPDVIRMREALSQLEQQRGDQLSALGVTDLNQEISGLDSNPIYQALRISLNEVEVEIDGLAADVRDREGKVAQLRALADEVPLVEAELARLNRDYDVIYNQYQNLVESRETQALSRKATDTDDVEFRVIDPPLADFEPVAPDRVMLLAGVIFAAFGAGAALCWLLAQVRPVFSSTATLRAVTGLPVLGVVSEAWAFRYRTRRRLAALAFAGAVGALLLVFLGAAFIEIRGPGLHTLVEGI